MHDRTADVEKLARGEVIASESFLAILADPDAVAQLAAQRELRWLLNEGSIESAAEHSAGNAEASSADVGEQPIFAAFAMGPPNASADAAGNDPPAMDVSWEELALYVEDRLADPARAQAVRRFLELNFPEAVRDRASLRAASAADLEPPEHRAPGQRLRYRDDSELA